MKTLVVINSLMTEVSTSPLICAANQLTGFYDWDLSPERVMKLFSFKAGKAQYRINIKASQCLGLLVKR